MILSSGKQQIFYLPWYLQLIYISYLKDLKQGDCID